MSTVPTTLQRSARRWFRKMLLPVFTLSLLGAMWMALFHQLDTERASNRKEATAGSQALARTLADHVSHILRQTDHATQLFKLKFEESGGQLRLPEFARRDGLLDSALPPSLDLPMALYDRNGVWLDSANAIVPDDVSQMPFFRELAGNRRNLSLFNTHVVDPRTHKWHIQIARRLNDRAGRFAGVIIVMVDPMYFVADRERLNLHDNDMVALFRADAGLSVGRVGERLFIENKLGFVARTDPGVVEGELAPSPNIDATARIYAGSEMPRFGLTAVVGVNERAATERFRRHEAAYVRAAAIASVAIVLVSLLLMRQSAQLRASMREARTAQATLRAASEGSLDALWIFRAQVDDNGRVSDYIVVDTNERGAAMLKMTRAQLLGQPVFATVPRLRSPGFLETFTKVMDSGVTLEEEVELRFDNRPSMWVHHQIVPLKDGVAVTTRDITERKLAELQRREQEQNLRSSEAQLLAVTNASPLGLMRSDIEGGCIYVNRRFETMTGMSADQARGDGWWQTVHPEDRGAFAGLFEHQRHHEEPFQTVLRCLRPDGDYAWISFKVAAVRIGGRIEGFVGSMDDITSLRTAELALRESEARLRTIADTMPAMVAYVDAHQVYRFHNRAYEREFGREGMAVAGRTVLDTVGAARYQYLAPYIERALGGETVVFEENDAGNERAFEVTYIPQPGEDGDTVVGFHVMRQDISSQHREKKRLLRLAQIDALTGLANRAGFLAKLDSSMHECAANGRLMAVMYMDIDRFKPVNDTYGHAVGDKLLKAFAGRLTHALRDSDTVARLGGDEFTVIMEALQREEDACAAAAKIVASMQKPFDLDGVNVSISTSIGVTFYRDGAHDPDALLKDADMLLYQSKQAGRNTYRAAA